jgi:HEAT repeat protein
MRKIMTLLLCTLSLPAAAAGLEDRLLDLQAVGAGYDDALEAVIADPGISDDALSALAGAADWRLRQQAAVALGWRTHAALYAELDAAEPMTTRIGSLRFTGDWRGQPEAAPVMLDRLLHDGDNSMLRAALVESLVNTGGDWAEAVAALMPAEPDAGVREAMAGALRDGEGAAALPALEAALSDAAPAVRAEAARSIGWRPDGAALADGLTAALSDGDADVRAAAARSLGVLGVEGAAGALEGLLDDARLNALRAIERVDPAAAAALPQLDALRSDADGRVARLAAKLAG